VKLCESIGAISVAEGVESEGILEKLREVGCSEGQGYYFAPPMSFEELKRFLGNRNHDKDN
ncbi:MAG TPA: EAL domain-containing protein, partial [Aquificaceae bacterium]|nr:EAL domain-containing protein [Aquificaceae bacterium]